MRPGTAGGDIEGPGQAQPLLAGPPHPCSALPWSRTWWVSPLAPGCCPPSAGARTAWDGWRPCPALAAASCLLAKVCEAEVSCLGLWAQGEASPGPPSPGFPGQLPCVSWACLECPC